MWILKEWWAYHERPHSSLRLVLFKPFTERRLAFAGRLTEQYIFNAYILVQIRPMNSFPFADQAPILPFFGGSMQKTRYHASGTEIVRPSSISTVKLSAVTTTCFAAENLISIAKVVIPESVPLMCRRLIRALRTSLRPRPRAGMVLWHQTSEIQLLFIIWTPRDQKRENQDAAS